MTKSGRHWIRSRCGVRNLARNAGSVGENPAEHVDAIRDRSKEARRPFTIDELKAVMAVPDPEWQSLLKEAGIPHAVVQELVAHDSEQMSALYAHVVREALETAAAALPEI